ncbi:glycoside hydrolase family 65 protein [Rubrobacter indicoceani]|uniref:glycoside hydrolase family 65 protein n=1 Tax=Rubrobacter indicoceani TaxID=2051957 RepID=UPI000E5AEFE3|nr:glycosyl hydrolase family 65 protein [Rubrobacter indicoceani]
MTNRAEKGWTLLYDGFEPDDEGLREALTSTGNGYFCTRGTFAWAEAGGVHYPGTYMHGGYNRETTIMDGVPVLNEDLVNLPNWLLLELRIEGQNALGAGNVEFLEYKHELDIKNAVLKRRVRLKDDRGRVTLLETRRFVSMADRHLGAMEWRITPENWSGEVEIISALDGRVTNRGVARYRDLEGRHLDPVSPRTFGPEIIGLLSRTRQSRIYVAEAARTRVYRGRTVLPVDRSLFQMSDYIHQVLTFEAEEGTPIRVEKMVGFFTSHDHAITEPLTNAGQAARRFPSFAEALDGHSRAWAELWDVCDISVPNDERVQLLHRLHAYHVLQVCSPHTTDLDAGVPARGLNGEAYRGHIFWDELYVYPFLNLRLPRITRSLLMYRYRRLDEARALAKESGYRGAMYPWQSGSGGGEETQVVHLNPNSGNWDPDASHNQRHVSAAIFYNIWRYYEASGDDEFLNEYGAEMMVEIARFWASIAHFNPARGRYEIHGVMGPDEFHEKYPDSEEEGLRNNAYTNVMVAWISTTVRRMLDGLPARLRRSVLAKTGLTDREIERFAEMSEKMFVPFHDTENGEVISQFEGYDALEDLDWDAYREKYDNIQRLDRILKAEGDDPDRYKLAKQADTVLIFFLFSEEEIRETLEALGYEYTPEMVLRNIEYYDERTSHGSTLSFIAHAGVLAGIDPESSWERYLIALESDVGDVQGGTTKEGIHLGVMAGTLDLIQRGYLGARVVDGALHFDPKPVKPLEGMSFPMQVHGTRLEVSLEGGRLTVRVDDDPGKTVRIMTEGGEKTLEAGESHTF